MPRIPHSLLLRAYNISPLLPLVLRATRTLPSAIRELRWLDEHVKQEDKSSKENTIRQRQKLIQLCKRRERGEPLQYILGSQPFGELSIKCRPGVLIPRWVNTYDFMSREHLLMCKANRPETEAYTTHLADLLIERRLHRDLDPRNFGFHYVGGERELNRPLKILDLCSGTGCISLLLYSLLQKSFPNIRISGYDISEKARKLSVENLRDAVKTHFHNSPTIEFRKINIFCKNLKDLWMVPRSKSVDIIISNPPYISREEFYKSTARSVRNFEPELALVPIFRGPRHDLAFFRRLLALHRYFNSRVLIMETSGKRQCLEVAREARTMSGEHNRIEIWRDWPGQEPLPEEVESLSEEHPRDRFPVRGSGSYRSVVLIRREEAERLSLHKYSQLQKKKLKAERDEKKRMQRSFNRKWEKR